MTATAPEKKKKKERDGDEAPDKVIERLNDHHALILLGDRPVVLREGVGADGREEIRLLSVGGFHEWMRPDVVWGGGARPMQASKLWFDSPKRRGYDGLVFDPSRSSPTSYYNMWKGWAVEPAPTNTRAKCQLFLNHVADNVCNGDEALFAWVMGWFASLFQDPTDKLGTSLVLRGSQGSGKTKVGEVIGSLLGHHYALVADSRYIVGRFNSHLANCLLLQLDEATWGGDHAAAGKLKDIITGEYQYIEYKGREPVKLRNYVRLLVTGNNRWLIPAGIEERRFAVLDVSDAQRQNNEYFRAIDEQLDNGGREALLRYLLDYDLKDIPLRTIPRTAALAEQKVNSLSPEQHWWLDILTRAVLPGDVNGEGETETEKLYTHYVTTSQRAGVNRKSWETQLGHALRGMVPKLERKRRLVHLAGGGSERQYVYRFPSLLECRKEFDRITGDSSGWGDDAPTGWLEDRSK